MQEYISNEMYLRNGSRGNRAEIITCYYVEKQLDRYRILKGET